MLIVGLALIGLGGAMFALGIFHGFEHGSCSTTGYDRHYGPINRCAKGTGWWMLVLVVGLFVLGGGAALSRVGQQLAPPILFLAVGAPFIALAFRSGHGQLLLGSSSSTGKVFAGVFGACFVIGGLVWGAVNMRAGLTIGGASLFGSALGSVAGVALAFALAAVVSSAIGTSTSSAASRQQSRKQALSDCVAASSTTPQILACERKYGTP